GQEAQRPHDAPPGARFMNALRWALFAGLLILAAVSVASYVAWRAGSARQVTAEHKHARYYCPMHPSYTSDRPGECPICGMTLEPIPSGGIAAASAGATGTGDVPGLTTVHITPERVQLIGVRTAVVEKRPLAGRVEMAGFV